MKTAALVAIGSGVVAGDLLAMRREGGRAAWFNINRVAGASPRMQLRFFPYELKLKHVFTVATYSRSTTPDVQVELEYDGLVGYGEASMPPYLQKELGTVESVMAFLRKVQEGIGRFDDPFQLEDILAYIDGLSEGNAAAKAAWVSCCRRRGTGYGDWTRLKHPPPPLLSVSIRRRWCGKRPKNVPTNSIF